MVMIANGERLKVAYKEEPIGDDLKVITRRNILFKDHQVSKKDRPGRY